MSTLDPGAAYVLPAQHEYLTEVWVHLAVATGALRESMVDCLRDQLIPPASLIWLQGESLAEPGNQETSQWDRAGHANNQPWITFLTRELFIRNLFISCNK